MSLELFLVSVALTLAVIGGALHYLRAITRRVLVDLCAREGSEAGAEFWLRAADVLAIAGSLILVLTFGGLLPEGEWIAQVRLVLGLALLGLFVTVVIVASSVWRFVPAPATTASGSAATLTSATAVAAAKERV